MKDKYVFYTDTKNRMVIAATHYAGRTLRATAKCSPEDTFDIEYGKRLAMARCEQKKAKIKVRNASAKYLEASENFIKAKKRLAEMQQYFTDAVDQYDDTVDIIKDIK